VWALALVGLALDLLIPKRIKALQIVIYLAMGWLCTVDYAALRDSMAPAGMWWLTAGGLAYTVGVIFYVLDGLRKLTHAHGIWHLFVLAGSISHFVSIIVYVH
jgi:hemolysin III